MEKLLKNLGLSIVEAKIYVTLIKYGPQTILELSKNANINRSYSYNALEKLSKKGFIVKDIINDKMIWKALSPKHILLYLDELKENIKKYTNKLSKIYKKMDDTEINIYEGQKGILAVCDDIAESKTKVMGFGAEGKIKEHLPYSYKHIFEKIKNNNVQFELIALKNRIPVIKNNTKIKNFKKEFNSCVEINVFEDKTIIFFWKKNLKAVVIKDEDVANSFRNYHKLLWKEN